MIAAGRLARPWRAALVPLALAGASLCLMLTGASPEFTWDEAYRIPYASWSWSALWSRYAQGHGPMSVYLAKLGQSVLAWAGLSAESQARFFAALIGSASVALLYVGLRKAFKSSRSAAFLAAGLLLFSVIRIRETNIIGPHHLMLACTLAMIILGFTTLDRLSPMATFGLGGIAALAALSMTYVIPVALICSVAVTVAGGEWVVVDRRHLKISWHLVTACGVAVIITLALWPAGILRGAFVKDFLLLLRFQGHATLVGSEIYTVAPRWAAGYWLCSLEAPLLVSSIAVAFVSFSRAVRDRRCDRRQLYLGAVVTGVLATTLTAHLAGARNILLLVGVLALAVGAMFDEAVRPGSRLSRGSAVAIVAGAGVNFLWLWFGAGYVPSIETDGYRAFLRENESRLLEERGALVYGMPVLRHYVGESGRRLAWEATEIPWTTSEDAAIPANVRYVLMPEFVYKFMPPGQPMRRVVAGEWVRVWTFRGDREWALSLFERPR